MKKLIKPLTLIITLITMSLPAYAKTSHNFNNTDYTSDNKILSTNQKISNITLSENVYTICSTDDYIYIEYYNMGDSFSQIYRSSHDLKEQKLIATIPELAYSLCYYDNSLFYINPVEDDYSVNEICSLNIDTKKLTKHITYSGDIELCGISNNYIYFIVDNNEATRIYKQNINNPLDKKLIYYSSHDYILKYELGENKLYISTFDTIKSIDLKTSKIVNSYNLNSNYELLGEYNNKLYLYYDGTIYKALENNIIETVSENTENNYADMYPILMTKGKILLSDYNYNTYLYSLYKYDIDNDKWSLITSYNY